MNFDKRRNAVLNKMENKSIAVIYSGVALHVSADEYAPFDANHNFFYLTGLRAENMALILDKAVQPAKSILFIEESDPHMVRWTGKMVTTEEAKELTGIEDVRFISGLSSAINRIMLNEEVENAYFDTYRYRIDDLPDYNLVKANAFQECYPGITVKNIFPLVAAERMVKDEDEIREVKSAVTLTKNALEYVMQNLKPGMKEYQVQADFEYHIQRNGAEKPAFPTIAGSGINATCIHYQTNQELCKDGDLILLDLGARTNGYNSDITRTYPVNGKFTERQRQVYNIVLAANQAATAAARPGVTPTDLFNVCKAELAKGLLELGLITSADEVTKYSLHGTCHHLGIDVHDVTAPSEEKLKPGAIVTNEPGLYIDDWEIGIRIEDDLLITEDGCEVLSKDIIRTAEEIEAFMNL